MSKNSFFVFISYHILQYLDRYISISLEKKRRYLYIILAVPWPLFLFFSNEGGFFFWRGGKDGRKGGSSLVSI